MVFSGEFCVAVRCESCSHWEIHSISLFELRKGEKNPIRCSCEDSEFYIETKDYKTFTMTVPCAGCGETHVFHYTIRDLFTKQGHVGKCSHTYGDILLVGNRTWIKQYIGKVHKEVLEIMKQLGFYNYFCNPEIMIRAINRIHAMAQGKKLYCDCGSTSIHMNLYYDRIELKCMHCSSINVIYTENGEDLKNLMRANPIVLHQNAFTCIDAADYTRNTENR